MRASRVAQLTAWYVALLLPTLYVKHRFMLVLARWWVEGSSTGALSDGEIASHAGLWLGHVAPPDVIEVAAIVLLLWLIGHGLLRIAVPWLATVSVALALVFLGLTLIALRETGTLLTWGGSRSAWRWIAQDGRVATPTPSQWLLLFGGAIWVAAPVGMAELLSRAAHVMPRLRRLVPAAAVALVAAAIAVRPDVVTLPWSISLSRGLWTSAAIALASEADDRPSTPVRSAAELTDEYTRLVYPTGRPASAPLVEIPPDARRPRHVLVLLLETAPRALYQLADTDTLPTFSAMSQQALIGDRHMTAAPRTDLAVHAIMSGTYSRGPTPIYEFGRFRTDGLATVLAGHGYDSTYIDSITLKWNVREEALAVTDFGFARLIEESDAPLPSSADPFETAVARERSSLALARTAIVEAERRGRKALVAVATNIGHYPWRATTDQAAEPPAARVAHLARVLDGLMADLLDGLAAEGLAQEVVIVIAGDHGLRFAVEFESFGVPIRHGDLMFNVPLMIYAPGLFPRQVRVPWVTSHVDLEPTLLDLLGVPRDRLLLHGENMLDRRLAERVTFLPSGMFAPMYPVDGLHYRGTLYTWAYALDRVRARPASPDTSPPLPDETVRDLLMQSRRLFNDTSAHFLAAAPRN